MDIPVADEGCLGSCASNNVPHLVNKIFSDLQNHVFGFSVKLKPRVQILSVCSRKKGGQFEEDVL